MFLANVFGRKRGSVLGVLSGEYEFIDGLSWFKHFFSVVIFIFCCVLYIHTHGNYFIPDVNTNGVCIGVLENNFYKMNFLVLY